MVRKVPQKPVRSRTKKPRKSTGLLPAQKKVSVGKAKKGKVGKRIRAKLVPEGKRVKIVIFDNTVRKFFPTPKIIVRSKLELAVLSPFRFPLPQERVIGSVARYAGVFFVLVGGFFSLLNLEYASGTLADIAGPGNLAQTNGTYTYTGDSGGDTSISGGTTGTYVPPPSGSTDSTGTIDPTPDVRIAVDAPLPLKGVVPFNVIVPYASKVKLLVDRDGSNTTMFLGEAVRIDNSTWRFYWQTTQYPDGEYRMRAAVLNEYGSYEHQDSTKYLVDNIPDTQAAPPPEEAPPQSGDTSNTLASTTSGISGTATTTDTKLYATTTLVTRIVTLRILETSPLEGGAPLEVSAGDATDVKVYARNTGTGALYYAGIGVKTSSGVWKLEWDTKKVPDGNYALKAIAMFSGGTSVESPLVSSSVKNGTTLLTQPIATTTQPTTTTASTVNTTATTTEAILKPTIDLRIGESSPVSGFVEIFVKTSPVLWVELYLVPKSSLTQLFLGIAQKISSTDWKYNWQTTQSPNGDYELYSRVKTEYGFTEGKRIPIRVLNEVVSEFTDEEEKTISTLSGANSELITVTENAPDTAEEEPVPEYVAPKVVYVPSVTTFIEEVESESETAEEDVNRIEEVLTEFRKRLNIELNNLARAEREGNEDELRRVKENIENLRADVIKELKSGVINQRDLLDRIDGYLTQVTNDLRDLTLRNEQMLKERVGDAIVKDSDKDGITDYDEVNLYLTNPFAADTDGDSYIDSIEIKLGYDPLSSKSEALVTYESPQEVGVTREDILTVETITTLSPTETETTNESAGAPARALISGKGLPNSFVTLYIYSTPIVLTVKTDSEGAWSYVFDKELEEGEHEVYVGITDNAGRIVAKSAPLPFVKTAVAFTETETAAAPINVSPEPTLIDERMLLLVASIAIAGLGLVLILLGLHVRGREEEPALAQAT